MTPRASNPRHGLRQRTRIAVAFCAVSCALFALPQNQARSETPSFGNPQAAAFSPESWRKEHRIIDLHMHIDGTAERFARAVRIMDLAGLGVGVNLSGGTVTHAPDELSEFARVKALADKNHPGRFVHYMNLDYAGWNEPDFSERAGAQIEEGHRLGAAGFKEYKRLGLFLRDANKQLIKIDDPKLDAVWEKCGELGMPVSIHVADPRAFWLPYDETNERWIELKDHRSWWFGDSAKYPPREELLAALNRVIARHPKTTFVCVHFANNAEDLAWVDKALDAHPNMCADLAARIPELGRHDPAEVRRLFTRHADRIFFATDFMVYDKLILGSGGDADRPTDHDALTFFETCWRWLETNDRDWAHMSPIQGAWTIDSIGLTPEVLRKIYFDNARRLLARSLPLPTLHAARSSEAIAIDGRLDEPAWTRATPARIEYASTDSVAAPALSTTARVLWSADALFLCFESPFTTLSNFSPAQRDERFGLWENDVVEAFIGPDPEKPETYTEYEWAPNGEQLDLRIDPVRKDFAWSSGMQSAVGIDQPAKVWRVEIRIPLRAISADPPTAQSRWRINFYRHDKANNAHLAWSPTLTNTFHTPRRFGWLEFAP
jgi:predicted TIM-barrel fold metal-dependent hydrolase